MNRADFEKELKQNAINLLRVRAGNRFDTFEAGQLYQICLLLGMKDYRTYDQETNWRKYVCSCPDEKTAKKVLKLLLSLGKQEKVQT